MSSRIPISRLNRLPVGTNERYKSPLGFWRLPKFPLERGKGLKRGKGFGSARKGRDDVYSTYVLKF